MALRRNIIHEALAETGWSRAELEEFSKTSEGTITGLYLNPQQKMQRKTHTRITAAVAKWRREQARARQKDDHAS